MGSAISLKKTSEKIEKSLTEDHLIIFDRKVILLTLFSFVLFFILVAFKIHGSSIPIWNQLVTQDNMPEREGRIFGWPQGIRSDEWVVSTPFALSQAENKFPLSNESLGDGNVPLLMNLPVNHVSTVFRPQHWGYFILGTERGFAFFWDFKHLSLFLGFFFLFMLLTRNQFWLSVFGSLWIYFSSFTQWWFNSAEMMGIAALIFVSIVYLLLSKKKAGIIGSSVLLTLLGIDFVLFLYPPYQVQLGYLVLFLLAGFLLQNFSKETFKKEIMLKAICAFASLAVAVGIFFAFYNDTRETMRLIMGTVYPGSRRSVGGGKIHSNWARYFSGFYGGLIRDGHVPKNFLNASEASNFILLYPIVIVGVIWNFLKKQKNDSIVILMLFYVTIITLWMKLGFPAFLANITLLSFVPTERSYMGLGLASVIATVVFIGTKGVTLKNKRQITLITAVIFVAFLSYGLYLTSQTEHFFMLRYILPCTIGFTFASIFLLQKRKLLFGLSILFVTVTPAIFINPVSVGLGPILKKDLSIVIQKEKTANPGTRWAVYGNRLLPNFFIASGSNVFDGVKYTPPMGDLKILDPEGKYNNVYNRYAHLGMSEKKLGENDITFELIVPDHYVIHIDPCDNKLKQIGITNLAFDSKPPDNILSCANPITDSPINNTWLYRYK